MSAATVAPPVRRILAINMSHIGGVLLMTPALELLHQLYPEAEISALVRSGTEPVLQNHPLIARIYTDGKITGNQQMHKRTKASLWERLMQIPHGLRLIAVLRRQRFDLAVHFTDSDRGALYAFLCGAPQRVGHRARGGLWSKNHFYTHLCLRPETRAHKVKENAGLIRSFATGPSAVELDPGALVLNSTPEELAWAQSQWQAWNNGSRPRVVVHPAARVLYKCWEPEKWTALIGRMQVEFNANVMVTSGPDTKEIQICEQVARACRQKIQIRPGDLSLRQLAALIRQADLFLGVDTAPMHIAAAVGTRVVAVFGPSDDKIWAPWGTGHHVVRRPCPCLETGVRGCDEQRGMDCLKTLTVEEAYCAVKEVLQK
jgi:heptosyltransferase-3